jgi:hypothetical protein
MSCHVKSPIAERRGDDRVTTVTILQRADAAIRVRARLD